MEQLSNKNPRIEVVDALRGFAVMANGLFFIRLPTLQR